MERLVNPSLSEGLPAFLTVEGGLNSGFMIAQYVSASLVSENKVLCHPASADSIPTGANVEDHVSMGTIAARHAMRVADNVVTVLAIEALAAAQAVELRRLAPSRRSAAAIAVVREACPFRPRDPEWGDALGRMRARIRDGSFADAALGPAGRRR